MELSPCPLFIAQPVGTDQLYVLPETSIILYVSIVPSHCKVLPDMAPPEAGSGLIVIGVELLGPVPQAFEGTVVMVPGLDPKVTVIELVPCPAVILLPEGTDHA